MPSTSAGTGTANFCHSKMKILYYINLLRGSAVRRSLSSDCDFVENLSPVVLLAAAL